MSNKLSTKVLAIAPLLLLVLSKIIWTQHDTLAQAFLWASYVAECVFILRLIVENKTADWFYSTILGLIIIGSVGALFKVMHWPLAGVMLWAGIAASILTACSVLYSVINKKNQSGRFLFLILGICLFLQLILVAGVITFYKLPILTYARFLHYPIAAMCGTILLKNESKNSGERNLILYLLVHSLFVIIKQTF